MNWTDRNYSDLISSSVDDCIIHVQVVIPLNSVECPAIWVAGVQHVQPKDYTLAKCKVEAKRLYIEALRKAIQDARWTEDTSKEVDPLSE